MKKKNLTEMLEDMGPSMSLQPFSESLQPIIEETLIEEKKDKCRKGTLLTPCLLVWFILAMTLRRDLNYHKVLNWLASGIRWMQLKLPAKLLKDGTISRARLRLGFGVLRIIFEKFVHSLKPLKPDFHGFISVIFDGTALTMPDTESNREEFGKPKTGRGQAAFPQMRVVALMARTARIILDVAFAPFQGKGTGERTLMMQILQRFKHTDLLFMFDAGFYSFFSPVCSSSTGSRFSHED